MAEQNEIKINIPVYYVSKISKAGNTYSCLEIHLAQGVKKQVFLENAEKALLEMALSPKQ